MKSSRLFSMRGSPYHYC